MRRLKLQIEKNCANFLFPQFQKKKIQKLLEILLIFENFVTSFGIFQLDLEKKKTRHPKISAKFSNTKTWILWTYLMLPSRDERKRRKRGRPGGKSSSKVHSTDKNDCEFRGRQETTSRRLFYYRFNFHADLISLHRQLVIQTSWILEFSRRALPVEATSSF